MTTEAFVFGNNIDTSLTSGITSGATTIPVASVSGFPTIPSGQYLALTLIHPATAGLFEIVYVTAVSGLNLTVLRGQEGSTAAAWASGDTIFSDVTQGILQNFNNVIQFAEYSLGGTDSGVVNAYVVALTPPITSYKDGMRVAFRAANTNTGSSTLDAGGGPKYIIQGANVLQGYEILATVITEVIYDATNQQWILGTGAIRQVVQPALYSFQTPNFSQLNGLQSGMKNRLINGAMQLDQRNGGASGTATGYTVDRWQYQANLAGKGTWGQNYTAAVGPANFPFYLGFQSNSAYTPSGSDFFLWIQPIEAYNTADFLWGTSFAKTATLSFWVTSSLTGTFGGAIRNYGTTRSYPFSYTIPVANAWTYISIVIPGDTAGTWVTAWNAAAIEVIFGLGCGTTYAGTPWVWANTNYITATGCVNVVATNNATFLLTGVQLEAGGAATSFEYRQIVVEDILCKRYYEPVAVSHINGVTYQPNGDTRSFINFLVSKRVTPTMSYTGSTSVIAVGNSGAVANVSLGSLTVQATTTAAIIALISNYSAFSGCGTVFAWGDNGGGSLTFFASAEM